jgi:hypothetical protein
MMESNELAMGKYILMWVPMVLIAFGNALVREGWYGKHLSELRAHQISTATCVLLFGVYIWVLVRTWQPDSPRQAFAVGLAWLGLTVAFEFLFGHFVAGHPWGRLFHDYNIFAGRVWILVLIWIAVAPYLFYRLQR